MSSVLLRGPHIFWFSFFLHFSFSYFSIFFVFLIVFSLVVLFFFFFLPGQEGSTSTTTRQAAFPKEEELSQPKKKGPTLLYESISQTCFVRIMFLRFHLCNIGRDKWINRKRETNKKKKRSRKNKEKMENKGIGKKVKVEGKRTR